MGYGSVAGSYAAEEADQRRGKRPVTQLRCRAFLLPLGLLALAIIAAVLAASRFSNSIRKSQPAQLVVERAATSARSVDALLLQESATGARGQDTMVGAAAGSHAEAARFHARAGGPGTSLASGNGGGSNAAASAATTPSVGGGRPNVVFILIDDMGFNDIGHQSSDVAEMSPHMDRLAASGIKLTNYYSSYLCTPARSTLLTGRYPFRYGLQYSVILPTAPYGLDLGEKLLPEYMNDNGYASHMVGKWHLGSYKEEYLPHRRGFETFLGYLNDEEDYYTHTSWSVEMHGKDFVDFGYADRALGYTDPNGRTCRGASASSGKYSTQLFTDRAIEVGKSHAENSPEKPLFLYLAHQAVHDPLGPPPNGSFSEEEQAALDRLDVKSNLRVRFAEVLLFLDKEVGRLVSSFDQMGYAGNTLYVVASDNGGCPWFGSSNYPLRGMKHTYWEGGSKVPAFLYGPGIIPKNAEGTKFSGIFSVADWLPTLTDLTGGQLRADMRYDGVSQWGALLAEEAPPRDTIVYNFDMYQDVDGALVTLPPKGAIRVGKWKLIVQEWCAGYFSFGNGDIYPDGDGVCGDLGMCGSAACGPTCSSLGEKYKPGVFLFDLEEDPTERHNLIDSHPDVAKRLRTHWVQTSLAEHARASYLPQMESPALLIWEHHGRCMVPWWDIFLNHNETAAPDDHGDPTRPSGRGSDAHIAAGEFNEDSSSLDPTDAAPKSEPDGDSLREGAREPVMKRGVTAEALDALTAAREAAH